MGYCSSLTPEEVKSISHKEKRYVAFLDGKYILMQHPARYVNHSCDANTYAKDFCDIAKRDIKKVKKLQEIILKMRRRVLK